VSSKPDYSKASCDLILAWFGDLNLLICTCSPFDKICLGQLIGQANSFTKVPDVSSHCDFNSLPYIRLVR
jgi:hypothetical protein